MSEPELVRNYLAEARLIWAGKSAMIPERAHLEALMKYIMELETEAVELEDKLKLLERETWYLRVPTGERDSA